MRVLVTGIEGFTGHYIQSQLETYGHTVVALLSDLTDFDAVANEIRNIQPQAVVHLAGVAFVGHGNANAFYEVNLIGTRNLLASLAQHSPDVQSILLASSANVYGNRSEDVLSEDSTAAPINDYAVSKLAMEQMAKLWINQLPIFIVRPFNYTGIGQDKSFLIPKIVSHFIEKKTTIEVGNIDVWREFGDVRTVTDIYRRLLERCPVGETLNVCTGQTYSFREVIDFCEKITGHKIEVQVNPEFVRANEVRVLKGDNSRLTRLIGETHNYNLEETLRWMFEDSNIQ